MSSGIPESVDVEIADAYRDGSRIANTRFHRRIFKCKPLKGTKDNCGVDERTGVFVQLVHGQDIGPEPYRNLELGVDSFLTIIRDPTSIACFDLQ